MTRFQNAPLTSLTALPCGSCLIGPYKQHGYVQKEDALHKRPPETWIRTAILNGEYVISWFCTLPAFLLLLFVFFCISPPIFGFLQLLLRLLLVFVLAFVFLPHHRNVQRDRRRRTGGTGPFLLTVAPFWRPGWKRTEKQSVISSSNIIKGIILNQFLLPKWPNFPQNVTQVCWGVYETFWQLKQKAHPQTPTW